MVMGTRPTKRMRETVSPMNSSLKMEKKKKKKCYYIHNPAYNNLRKPT